MVVSARVGRGRGFATVQQPVVVLVDKDRPAGEADFARIPGAVAIAVEPLAARDATGDFGNIGEIDRDLRLDRGSRVAHRRGY